MYPYRFELPQWTERFALEDLEYSILLPTDRPRLDDLRRMSLDDRDIVCCGWLDHHPALNITSPRDFVLLEKLRELIGVAGTDAPPIPTDLFVFAVGEPLRRDVTKVGGLPYRPAGLPWPQVQPAFMPLEYPHLNLRTEGPSTFLCQFCFSGSHDLLPELPGDILLVFADDYTMYDLRSLHYEWYPLGIEDLVTVAEVPPPAWEFVMCYGYINRTADYPSLLTNQRSPRLWPVACGTKIGGVPSAIVDGPLRNMSPGEHLLGRFIAQLGSIEPSDGPYPWINHPDPLGDAWWLDSHRLNLTDAGRLYFFLDENSAVRAMFSCG